jgi:hypothetical protein
MLKSFPPYNNRLQNKPHFNLGGWTAFVPTPCLTAQFFDMKRIERSEPTPESGENNMREPSKSLFENYAGCCGEGFCPWPRRRGRSIPAAGCNDRANASHGQKTRRPAGFQQKAVWLCCSSVEDPPGIFSGASAEALAPRQPAFCWKTASPGSFQTGSNILQLVSRITNPASCILLNDSILHRGHKAVHDCPQMSTLRRAQLSNTHFPHIRPLSDF